MTTKRSVVYFVERRMERGLVKALAAMPYVLKNPILGEGGYQYDCIPWKNCDENDLLGIADSKEAMLINLMPLGRWDAWLQSLYDHCVHTTRDESPQSEFRLPSGVTGWEPTEFGSVLHLNVDLTQYSDTADQKDDRFVAVPLTVPEASFVLDPKLTETVAPALHLPSGQLTTLQQEQLLVGLRGLRSGFMENQSSDKVMEPTPLYSAVRKWLNSTSPLNPATREWIIDMSRQSQSNGEKMAWPDPVSKLRIGKSCEWWRDDVAERDFKAVPRRLLFTRGRMDFPPPPKRSQKISQELAHADLSDLTREELLHYIRRMKRDGSTSGIELEADALQGSSSV